MGDEIDFDSHIVTIEAFQATEVANNTHQQTISVHRQPNALPVPDPSPQPRAPPPSTSTTAIPSRYNAQPMRVSKYKPPSTIPRKRIIKPDPDEMEQDDDIMEISEPEPSTRSMQPPPAQPTAIHVEPSIQQPAEIPTFAEPEPVQPLRSSPALQQSPVQQQQPSALNIPPFVPPVQNEASQPVDQPTAPASSPNVSPSPAKKRVRVGLSKKTSSPLHQVNLPTPSTSSYTPPTSINRPTATLTPSFTKASNIADTNAVSTEATSSNAASASFGSSVPPPPPNQQNNSSNGETSATAPFKSPFAEGK